MSGLLNRFRRSSNDPLHYKKWKERARILSIGPMETNKRRDSKPQNNLTSLSSPTTNLHNHPPSNHHQKSNLRQLQRRHKFKGRNDAQERIVNFQGQRKHQEPLGTISNMACHPLWRTMIFCSMETCIQHVILTKGDTLSICCSSHNDMCFHFFCFS